MRKILLLLLSIPLFGIGQSSYNMAILKYQGGGDWYANPTALPNLAAFCNKEINTSFGNEIATVDVGSPEIYNHPFIHMTGHGNVIFSEEEAKNLRNYLIGGGFLHIDDNYGMDPYVRPELKKVFPELDLVALPYNHPIYSQAFEFPDGLPKIHVHDNLPAIGLGLVYEGRLVIFYTFESDLGDGWEDQSVHKDSEATRQKALKMGANIVKYAFTNGGL